MLLGTPRAGHLAADPGRRAARRTVCDKRLDAPTIGQGEPARFWSQSVKITDVTTYHLPGTRYPWVFLRIDTDEGVHGWGQVSTGPHSTVVAGAASRLG